MYKFCFLLVFVLFFNDSLRAQESSSSWELPVNGEFVFYKQATTLPVKKDELCKYFYSDDYFADLDGKLASYASSLRESNWLKGVNSYSYMLSINNETEFGKNKLIDCNPDQNDTIYGKLTCNMNWISTVVTNGHYGERNISVDFLITIIFMNNEDVYVSLKGLSIKSHEFHPSTNRVKDRDKYLADAYSKFKKDKFKSKNDIDCYSRLNDLAKEFFPVLFTSLKTRIKLLEE